MRLSLSIIDVLLIVIYFGGIIWLGLRAGHNYGKHISKLEYLLSGRKLTTPLFVGTLVATWYGNILGVGEFVYNNGIVAWVCFGVTYYIAAILYAFLFAGKIRNNENYSIPDLIGKHFGETNSIISSIIVFIISNPATYILLLGLIIQLFTGWQLWICLVVGTTITIGYIYTGGFKADVLTNSMQFVLMYIGFGAFVLFVMFYYGSPAEMFNQLPVNHKSVLGDFSWMYILSWVFIALQTFVEPSFYQRCAAASSAKTARNGILISVAFWLLFDIMTLLAGLYAKAYLNNISPVMAYPALSEIVLPAFWKGLFVITLLATVMSSLDSFAFLSASTIGNDMLSKLEFFKNYSIVKLTRVGLIVTGIIGILISLALPSPIEIVFRTASIAVPGLILPVVFTYSAKYTLSKLNVSLIMVASSASSLILYILQINQIEIGFFKSIEPMIFGLFISLILAFTGLRRRI